MKKISFDWASFLMFIAIVNISEFCMGIIAIDLTHFSWGWIIGIFIVNFIIAIRFAQNGEIRK